MLVDGATRPAGHQVPADPEDGRRGHGLRQRDDQARRQGPGRRGVLRHADLDRGDGGRLERPLGHRLRVGLDQPRPHEAPVHDAALLRDAEPVLRPRRFAVPDGRPALAASRSAPAPAARTSTTSSTSSRSPASPSSTTSRTRSSSRSRPRARASQALADGKIDAFLAAAPVGQAQIDAGLPLRGLDEAGVHVLPVGLRRQELGPRRRRLHRPGQRDHPRPPGGRDPEGAQRAVLRTRLRREGRGVRPVDHRPDDPLRGDPVHRSLARPASLVAIVALLAAACAGPAGVRRTRLGRRSTRPRTSSPRSSRAARSSCSPTPTTRRSRSP